MPGAADGSIIVDTEIDTKGFARDSSKLQTAVTSLGRQVDNLGPTLRKAMAGSASAMASFAERTEKAEATIADLENKIEQLGSKRIKSQAYEDITKQADKAKAKLDAAHADMDAKLEALGKERVATPEYARIQKQIAQTERSLIRLDKRQQQMKDLGVSENSTGWKRLQIQIDEASASLRRLTTAAGDMERQGRAYTVSAEYERLSGTLEKLQSEYDQLAAEKTAMESSGTAYTLGSETAQYQELSAALESARVKLAALQAQAEKASGLFSTLIRGAKTLAGTVARAAVAVGSGLVSSLQKAVSTAGRLVKFLGSKLLGAVKSVASAVGKLFTGNGKLTHSVGGLTSSLKKLLPALLAARGIMGILRKAVNAYMDANVQVAGQLSATWSNLGNILGPIIQRLVNLVSTVTSYVVAFLRLLGLAASASTSAMEGAGGAAKKLKQQLSGLDEIHTWQDDSSGGGGGGSSGQATLPEVELPDWAKLVAEQLRKGEWEAAARILSEKLNEMVDNVDWPGLGDRFGTKFAGALKFLATFIRDFDFTELFTGLFTALEHAISKLDAEDLGTLLATKFVLIFSALQGALKSGIIPTAIEKIGGAIEGFFKTIREKFNDESDPDHGGWYVVGENIGNVIGQIVNSIASLLSGTSWEQIIGDIGEFWSGLWNALQSGSNAPDWGALFDAIQFACKRLLARMLQWLPQSGESKATWEQLETRLKNGNTVDWTEIFQALWDTMLDLVNLLIEHLPSSEELAGYWDDLKTRLADSLGFDSWSDLTSSLAEKLASLLSGAVSSAMDIVYLALRENHPIWASLLFPSRDTMYNAKQAFLEDLETGGEEAAARTLAIWQKYNYLTDEQAQQIAAEAGYSYSDGMLTALTTGLSDVTATCQQIMDESGRAAVNAYLSGLIAEGTITSDEAAQIVSGLAESMVSMTEMYNFELEQGGAEAAEAYLNGLIEKGLLSSEEAEQIVAAAAEAMGDDTSSFEAAGAGAADSYTTGLQGGGGNVTAAAQALREAAHAPVRMLREDMATELSGMKSDVSGAYDNMATSVSDGSGAMDDSNYTNWESIKDQVDKVANLIKNRAKETWDAMQRSVSNGGKTIRESNETVWTSVQEKVQTSLAAANNAATQAFRSMQSGAEGFGASVNQTMTSAMSTLRTTLQTTFSSLANSAVTWGRDICNKLSSGLQSGISGLANAASNAASSIRTYLHFSVPDKGPLADADSYMPDFMQLLTDGLKKNTPAAAKAAAGVAAAISSEIQDGSFAIQQIDVGNPIEGMADRMVDGFASMLERMQTLADNLSFRAPAVAVGGVVPYGAAISGARPGYDETDDGKMSELISLLKQYVKPNQTAQNSESRVSVNVRGRTLFDVVIEEGRAARKSTGRNPFTEL